LSESNVNINSTTGSDTLDFGRFNGTSGTANLNFDDIYVDDGNTLDDPGAISVTNKRPNANGANNQFATQIGSGGSGYGTGHSPQVNEQPLNVANGWQTSSASQLENYAIENASTGDVDISTATLIADEAWIYANSGASCTGNITNNGTTTATISLTTTNTMFTNIVSNASYPNNSAGVGIKSCASATTVSLYEAGMLIAYTSGGSGVPEGALLLLPIIPFVPLLSRFILTKWQKRRRA
jgi:hypothetical protein